MDAVVSLTGNIGNEIEYRSATEEQDAWASFRLGHTPGYFREGKWTHLNTVWVTVNCRRMLARNVNTSLHKGDSVLVTGRLRVRQWTDKEGNERESFVIEADSLGPDLSRGIGSFTRNGRRDDPAIRTGASGDDPWNRERPEPVDGPRTDQDTGEVLEPEVESPDRESLDTHPEVGVDEAVAV